MKATQLAPKPAALDTLALQCPPLPQTLLEAMDLMNRPEGPQLEQVLKMVQHDPGVVARLLRVVNSAYHGQRGDIKSVHRAVVILGSVSVTGIVMSMSLQEVRGALDAQTALPFLNLVRHSIATAFLGRHLLTHSPSFANDYENQQERLADVFTAALLHDFGKVILLYNFPEKASVLYADASTTPASDDDLLAEERAVFGHDHVETGVFLSRKLCFPDPLTTTIALHHRDVQLGEMDLRTKELVYIVKAANKAASALGYASHHPITWEDCCADPIWSLLVDENIVDYPNTNTLLQALLDDGMEMSAYVDAVI